MDSNFYGNITNTARTQFQFDKTYPNRYTMEQEMASDGIYTGRYVLIEYDTENLDCFTQLYKKSSSSFYYAEFPAVKAEPGINIANGTICYVRLDKDYTKVETNIRNIGACEFYIVENNKFQLLTKENNSYTYNWQIDYDRYKRGYDSTVWQKIYVDGKEKYLMIAELNAVVPQFTMSIDKPTQNPQSPHFDEDSTNLNYDLHIQPQWGMRIAEAKNPQLSDEKTTHMIGSYNSEGDWEETESPELNANIFYNKDAFDKYEYKPVEFSTDIFEYQPNKFYYIRNNVYALDNSENITDGIDYYIDLSNQYLQYYFDNSTLDRIDLLQTDEEDYKYEPGKFYYISYQHFSIVVEEEFDPNKQYYIAKKYPDGAIIYNPVKLTEDSYKPDYFYEALNNYELEPEDAEFSENKDYYVKNHDGTFSLVYLYDKPLYEPGKYYAYRTTAYIIDTRDKYDKNETYYQLNADGTYSEVVFTTNYMPYTYYYIDDSGEFVLERADAARPDVEYYEKYFTGVVDEINNTITVLPTGVSGKLYNNHKQGRETAKDIQEISILLPGVGNMMAEIWNLMYSIERNDLLYSSPFEDKSMYDDDGNPLYSTDENSVIGMMNKVYDLIGHNVIKTEYSMDMQENIDSLVAQYPNYADLLFYSVADDKYFRIGSQVKEDELGQEVIEYTVEYFSEELSMDCIYDLILRVEKLLSDHLDGVMNEIKKRIQIINTDNVLNVNTEFVGDVLRYTINHNPAAENGETKEYGGAGTNINNIEGINYSELNTLVLSANSSGHIFDGNTEATILPQAIIGVFADTTKLAKFPIGTLWLDTSDSQGN